MKITVVGRGNVGGGLADRWERSGHEVTRLGRDGGDYSFDFYMETKNICVALDTHKVPRIGA